MEMRPGVTIAIPNWNHESLLPRSIFSGLRALDVLRDCGLDGELLVIDDSSRDGSLLLLRQLEALYYQRGLRVLAFESNGGLAATRNQGLAAARFRYMIFMDADNEIVPENVPTLVKTLDATGAAAAFGNLLWRVNPWESASGAISNESIQTRLFRGNYIDAFAMLDRIQVLDLGGYDASCRTVEDHELWLHLITNGRKIVFVPVVFGYYYRLPSSMIQKEQPAGVVERIERIFNQVGMRDHLPLQSLHLRYHPATGYLT